MKQSKSSNLRLVSLAMMWIILTSLMGTTHSVIAQVPAGYSEYYISGSEEQMWSLFYDMDPYNLNIAEGMHAVISVTAASNNTSVYYDHWEDGYDFDINNPVTADETYTLNMGQVQIFQSANIPVYPRGIAIYYDGRDRLYMAGGMAQVSRASWTESGGTLFAQAWEIFPTKPYQNHYSLPVGEDLAASPYNYTDFTKSYVIVQSTQDSNTVTIDDPITPTSPDVSSVLNKGEVTQLYHINSGTTISATYPVQAQIIVGNNYGGTRHYESRDFTVVPTGLWDSAYYSPVGSFENGYTTELYIYNPYTTSLTINYEDSSGSGSFNIAANSSLSFSDGSGHSVPTNSAVYLNASQDFWAVGTAASESPDYDWGFSLVPEFTLTSEYFIGWAPGTSETVPTTNGSAVFVTPAQDSTNVFVDFSPVDGVVDATYTLDRMQVQKIFDPDNISSGMHVWGTAPMIVAWGEDPDTAGLAYPYLDMGNTNLPLLTDWIDAVISLDKSANPEIVPAGQGQQVTFTIVVNSYEYTVSDIAVNDSLPMDWNYIGGSTTINLPDGTTITGTAADPIINGQDLAWDLGLTMNPNETLTIDFTAETTASTSSGFSLNTAQATGTQGVHLFTAIDSTPVYVSDLSIQKLSSAGDEPVYSGDTLTYTIVITNNGSVPVSNIIVTDPLPAGMSYVAGSSMVYAPAWQSAGTFRDDFNTIAFNGSNGTLSWATNWLEIGENDGANAGDVRVVTDFSNYQLRVRDNNNGGEGVQREMNLSAYGQARLTFEYRRNGLDDINDYVSVSSSANGGSSWTELGRFQGPQNDATYQSIEYDISSYLASNSRIRFLGSPGLGDRDQVYFDNVQVEVFNRGFTSSPGGALPDLVTAADGYTLQPYESMTVTYQVVLDSPMPWGMTEVSNTAYVSSNSLLNQWLQDTVTNPIGDPTAISLASFQANSVGSQPLFPWFILGLLTVAIFVTGALSWMYNGMRFHPPKPKPRSLRET